MTDASQHRQRRKTFDAGDARRMNNLGSRRWHTDQSFKMRPVKYSLLCARTVAKQGGETQFADMRGAYDALPDELRERITDLAIEHSLLSSRSKVGFTDANELEKARLASVHQRLPRRHPRTGRRSLYLSSHAVARRRLAAARRPGPALRAHRSARRSRAAPSIPTRGACSTRCCGTTG